MAAIAAVLACALAGCGKRGNPLPPLRPLPGAFTDVQARRIGDRVELRFTIPAKNGDGTVPPVIERVDIYATVAEPPPPPLAPRAGMPPIAGATTSGAATPPAGQTVPPPATPPASAGGAKPVTPQMTIAKMQDAANLRGHVDVHRAPDESETTSKTSKTPPPVAEAHPIAGEVATYVGSLQADRGPASVSGTAVLQYLLVGVAGGRRTPSSLITVPLTAAPDPPTDAVFTYDEKTLTLAWKSSATDVQFRVYDVDETGKEKDSRPLGAAPLKAPPFTAPVEFGKPRCFAVHAVRLAGATAVESAATAPVCHTPVDTFPPPAPTLHPVVPSPGSVNLIWDAVEAADLAGYFVLRSDGADETLHALTTTPVVGTTSRDDTLRAGVRYVYAIVAVDKAGNVSPQSNRVEVIGR